MNSHVDTMEYGMVRSRIAPTPSGYLHLGNAVNFVLTAALVRKLSGHLHLRIDDLDAPRMRPEFVDDIFRQLEWLEIEPDSGPSSPAELKGYSQTQKIDTYHDSLLQLRPSLFACDCSRKQIRESSETLRYPGTCRDKNLPFDGEVAWRFRSAEDAGGDFVVRRRDGLPGYHIVSVVDDRDSQVNLVVRGEDLLESTAAQLAIARVLQLPFQQAQFWHHPLVSSADGEKLSKSREASPLNAMHSKGKAFVFETAGKLIGQPGTASLGELAEALSEPQYQ